MHAYVLAAGVGKRLKPLTEHLPKPMVPFLNRPLISYLLAHVQPYVAHTRVNVAYNKQPLLDYLEGYEQVSCFDEGDTPLGSAATLNRERDYCIRDTTLVVCGDLLSNWNVAQMLNFHHEKQALVTIAVCRVPDPRRYGVVVTDENQRIVTFQEKPEQPLSQFISCGIYLLSPWLFDHWQPTWKDLGSDVFPYLVKAGLPVYAWPLDPLASWNDLGTPQDYLRAHLSIGRGMNTIHHSAQIASSVGLRETVVGARATVHKEARLERCIVWPGTVVKASTCLSHAIITPHALIEVDTLC